MGRGRDEGGDGYGSRELEWLQDGWGTCSGPGGGSIAAVDVVCVWSPQHTLSCFLQPAPATLNPQNAVLACKNPDIHQIPKHVV